MKPDQQALQGRIEDYLIRLRHSLGNISSQSIDEILLEIRGHIMERVEYVGAIDDAKLTTILTALGRPEDIGSLYRTYALVTLARVTFSPILIFRTTIHWAKNTVLGFVAFMLGLTGYCLGLSLIACALLKPLFPKNIGLWIHPHGVELATPNGRDLGPELMGWWIIPTAFVVGILMVVGVTMLLRWMLRFASRPSPQATAPAQSAIRTA
jgi:hypothetical protein